jgi:arsenate reductase-like glutaredoxin family protein
MSKQIEAKISDLRTRGLNDADIVSALNESGINVSLEEVRLMTEKAKPKKKEPKVVKQKTEYDLQVDEIVELLSMLNEGVDSLIKSKRDNGKNFGALVTSKNYIRSIRNAVTR